MRLISWLRRITTVFSLRTLESKRLRKSLRCKKALGGAQSALVLTLRRCLCFASFACVVLSGLSDDSEEVPQIHWATPQAHSAPQKIMTFSGDQIRKRVRQVVERSPLLKDLEVAEIKPPRFSSQRAPHGSKMTIEVVGELRGGRLPVEISLLYQGRLLRKLRSFVEVDFFMTGWALQSTKTAGMSLSAGDLIEVRRPSRAFARDAIRDHTQVIGAKLRRSVGAKVPLRAAWLMIPPLVKRGAIVELIYNRKSISLTAQGEALGDGKKSDMIRVRNLNSKKIVTGRVIGINRIDVGRR